MSFKMDCPNCKRVLNVTEKVYGKTLSCPGCNQPMMVPQPKDSPAFSHPSPTSANPHMPQLSDSTRVCEWCAESIPKQALKCPRCTKWRKDIEVIWRNYIIALIGSLSLAICCVVGFSEVNEQSSKSPTLNELSGVWHDKVTTKVEHGGPSSVIPSLEYDLYVFSIKKFLTSVYGWIVIVLGILFVIGLFKARRAGNNLKRKTESFWP